MEKIPLLLKKIRHKHAARFQVIDSPIAYYRFQQNFTQLQNEGRMIQKKILELRKQKLQTDVQANVGLSQQESEIMSLQLKNNYLQARLTFQTQVELIQRILKEITRPQAEAQKTGQSQLAMVRRQIDLEVKAQVQKVLLVLNYYRNLRMDVLVPGSAALQRLYEYKPVFDLELFQQEKQEDADAAKWASQFNTAKSAMGLAFSRILYQEQDNLRAPDTHQSVLPDITLTGMDNL